MADKRLLRPEDIAAALGAAGVPWSDVTTCEQLPGGTYNTLHRVRLTDGAGLLVKHPPAEGTPSMTYESGLLRGEADFYDLAARHTTVPVPGLVHLDPDGRFLVMTELPGTTWDQTELDAPDRARLRRSLGRIVAELHTVTGRAFGYPSGAVPPDANWRGTFTAMLAAVLADAERFSPWLPVPVERVRFLADTAAPALDEVTAPALVHFDLWDGNVLLSEADGISGIIDGERMFWGDPLADFASLTLLGVPEDDPALLDGYRSGGGRTDFDPPAQLRMALYRCYLYLIMLVEVVPRSYPAEHVAWNRERTGPALMSALRTLESGG